MVLTSSFPATLLNRPLGNTFYSPNASYFDGINDIVSNLSLTGTPATPTGQTFSMWFKPDVQDQITGIFQFKPTGLSDPSSYSAFSLQMNAVGGSGVQYSATSYNNTPAAIWDDFQQSAFYPFSVWHHILVSMNVSTQTGYLYVNDNLEVTGSLSALSLTTTGMADDCYVGGAFNFASFFTLAPGSFSDVWFDSSYIDLSVTANRRKFITADKRPVFLGVNGQLPTGSQPTIYLKNPFNTFGTNFGTCGNFTISGALTASSPPTIAGQP